jgi:hypothetical protein
LTLLQMVGIASALTRSASEPTSAPSRIAAWSDSAWCKSVCAWPGEVEMTTVTVSTIDAQAHGFGPAGLHLRPYIHAPAH